MAVDTNLNFESLLDNLKLEDPWLPPRTWESIPSQSGKAPFSLPQPLCVPSSSSFSVSEASLVRLAMNAMQGVQSALISVEKLSVEFCSDPADRTFHRIPTLWSRSSSNHALGKILNSIGRFGLLVFLLHKFINYFTDSIMDEHSIVERPETSKPAARQNHHETEVPKEKGRRNTLVNQGFAVAIRKVLEGYMCALDTLHSSTGLRRSSPLPDCSAVGCLTSVVHSEMTLLEMYLHTKELRTQIEVLGNICNLQYIASCFSSLSYEDLIGKATSEFHSFYRGGDLLTYLYTQLQVADPAHCTLLKFLFLRSCEPYCGFIRSWIFKAEIMDPYGEFVIEYVHNQLPCPSNADTSADFPLARERTGVGIPCFLKDLLVPLVRAGQQLQVLVRLLELCTYVTTGNHTYEDFLSCWTDFSNNHPSYESAITFKKENTEAKVLARDNYYERLHEKLETILTKLEFRYQQVVWHDGVPNFVGHNLNTSLSFTWDDGPNFHSTEDRLNEVTGSVDGDDLDSRDEFDYAVDACDSSESSSIDGSGEQIEFGEAIELCDNTSGLKPDHFSLSAPSSKPLQKTLQCEEFCNADVVGHVAQSCSKSMTLGDTSSPFQLCDLSWPWNSDSKSTGGLELHSSDHGVSYSKGKLGVHIKEDSRNFADATNALTLGTSNNKPENGPSISNSFMVKPWNLNHSSNIFSMNPMLTKNAFLHMSSKPENRRSNGFGQFFSYFDFSTVEDPCIAYTGKLFAGTEAELKHELPLLDDSRRTVTGSKSGECSETCRRGGYLVDNINSYHNGEDILTYVSGGSSWENLLCSFSKTVKKNVEDESPSLQGLEIPLEFIMNKCLVQEIMLQYKYVSKLTIKLLEEGFDLQEHLLTLRRYHFMESADWTDLFIMSLWHHKWCVEEADRRLSEIQGYLELSIQRSSCEHDRNKDRLFVYIKEHCSMPFSNSTIGIHSFEFLGLGYRVNWPISIILTPAALKVYAEIFSFLIQVKLAVFSLTDVWSSLKALGHVNQSCHTGRQKREVGHFYMLVKIRHQVNHFVCSLQHYVESQLSHVSWCRFLQSLQHKVKDMMDLESVHMSYLTDSHHICFLSEEARSVASIIQRILQSAIDFRSCLTGDLWNVKVDEEDNFGKNSAINISQVRVLKQTFDTSLKELHRCYLKSPKHGEFGLSHFWGYLNYSDYYSDMGNEVGYYG